MIITIYVLDLLSAGKNENETKEEKAKPSEMFEMKGLSERKHCIGLQN